uniref:Uncharacterized protein n=1 Tax=Salarias fasciatus TaxID=181472 RepID=A0A672FMF4_SALFA
MQSSAAALLEACQAFLTNREEAPGSAQDLLWRLYLLVVHGAKRYLALDPVSFDIQPSEGSAWLLPTVVSLKCLLCVCVSIRMYSNKLCSTDSVHEWCFLCMINCICVKCVSEMDFCMYS